ncbi:DUF11 domain-containing protein [Nakamurella sp. YIM 132087]|uniref:DUF11 domain-containing protein n=1 Tax=Nakamurella alba TaxID=2665158 RepID=A0A7K1FPR6_9ACTN|nr:DUF11 domain-containing protein [Nakamurella alba]MTD14814.1 DUF11 domain-containing protein [Nakamurella alba]
MAVLLMTLGLTVVLTTVQAPVAQAAVPIPFNADFSAQENGAIALTGNSQLSCPTSASTCATARATATSSAARSGINNNDFTMAFVDADTDATTSNSSSANLALPSGSTVLYAKLIWGARRANSAGTSVSLAQAASVKFRTPASATYTALTGTVDDPGLSTSTDYSPYVGHIDVTSLVRAAGNGTYWFADMAANTGTDRYAGWSLIVAYRNPAAPLRDLRIYRGFANVNGSGATATATIDINGFLTPAAGTVNSAVGVVAWEGDRGFVGDSMEFNGTALSDATRPSNNFFDSAISDAGTDITNRNPNFTNNFGTDIGRINATNVLANSQTSTTVRLTTNGDTYYPTLVTTQIDLYSPAFNPVSKSVTNLSGNSPARVGDTLQYQISLTNTGSDPADASVITDALPANVTYVPGSLVVVANPGTTANTAATDAAGDDLAEYLAGSRSVRFRVGSGATASAGGSIGVNQTTTVRFRATLDRATAGTTVSNTADLAYRARTLGGNYTFTGNQVDTPVSAIADLGITKTSTPTSQTAGSQVTYTLTAVNNGPNEATSVVVTDTLPTGVNFVSAAPPSGTTCSASGRTVTCSTPALANGGTLAIPVTASIAAGSASGTTLTDTATISSAVSDDVAGNNTAVAGTAVTTSADVAVTHTVSPGSVAAGSQATWTLTATNRGPSTAASTVVTDTLPTGVTITSATIPAGTCTVTGSTVSCPVGDLAPNQSAVITVVTTVAPNTPAGTLTANGSAASSTPDPNQANNSAAAALTVTTSADLQVTTTAATDPVVAGRPETWTVTVRNNGPSDAAAVQVSVPAVAGQTITSASANQGTCSVTGGAVSCAPGTVAAGTTVTVTVRATVDPSRAAGPLALTGSASSTTTDPVPGNNSSTATVTVQTSADLSLTKVGDPNPVVAGDQVTYTLTVGNAGPSTATGASISDPLPTGVIFSSSADGCTVSSGTVTCPVGTVPVGSVVTRTFVADTDAEGTGEITNVATVSATTPDPVTANNTATARSTSETVADLQIGITASDPVIAGNQITYTITAINNGPSAAASAQIADTAPAGITFSGAVASGGGFSCSTTTTTMSCTSASLPVGVPVTVTLTGTVASTAAGAVTNTATISAATPDPSSGNNSASTTVNVRTRADVAVVLQAPTGPANTVVAGTEVQFGVRVTNAGPSVAQNVVVSGQVPAGLEPIVGSSGGACTVAGGTVTCNLGTLPVGADITIPLTALVRPSVDPGTVTGQAGVGASTTDPQTANNASTATIEVITQADLVAGKSVDPSPLVAGSPATYTLTVLNDGPSDARAVAVSDSLPAALTVLGAAPSSGSCTVAGQAVDCTTAVLPAGSTLTVTVPVTVSAAAGDTELTNTVLASSDATDPTPSDNSASVTSAVERRAHLTLTKTQDATTVEAGSSVTYTLALTNTGPSDAAAVTLADTLPGTMTVVPGGVSATGDACTIATGNRSISCDFGTVPAGQARTVQVIGRVPSGTAAGTVLTNTATAESTTPDTTTGSRSASSTGTVSTAVDLGVIIAPVQDPAEAGSPQGYVLSVVNNGPSFARGAVVSFPLPTGTTFDSATTSVGSCSASGGTVTCSLGDLAPGAAPTVQINLRLDPDLGGSRLTATASVSSQTPDPVSGNNSSSVTQAVAARSDLQVTKTVTGGAPVAGGTVEYRITVTNPGPSTARNPVVTDRIPAGTTFVSATASDDGSCRPGEVLTCRWPSMAVGATRAVTLVLAVPSDTAPGTAISNTASAASDSFDNSPATATATADTTVTTSADLSVRKTVLSGNPVAGGSVQWQIVVRNLGPSAATAVTVDDTPATGVTFTSAATGTGTCSVTGGPLHCELGTLPSGSTVALTVTGTLSADYTGETVGNTATVTSPTSDPVPGNNSATVSTETSASGDLSLTKTVSPATPVAGERATWTLTASNAGPSTSRNVIISDVVPSGVSAIAAVVSGGGTCTATPGVSPGTTVVRCPVATIAAGSSATATVSGLIASNWSAPTVTNTGTVSAGTADPDPTGNSATATAPVGTATALTLTASAPATIDAGRTIGWTFTAANAGPSDARGVQVVVDLPSGIGAVTGSGPGGACTVSGSTATCPAGTVPVGGSAEIVLSAVVNPSTTGALPVSGTASTTSPEAVLSDNTATASTVVTASADLTLAKTFTGGGRAVPGGPVSWNIRVTSAGPSDATGVVVTDTLPAGVSGIAAVWGAAGTACDVDGQTVTCALGTVPPTVPVDITVTGTLSSGFAGTDLVNTATVTSDEDPDPSGDTATSTTPVAVSADLRIGKALVSGIPVAGDTATFELRVSDLGPSDATGVVVTDRLPDELLSPSATVAGNPGTCSIDGRDLTCELGTVPVGSTPVITVTGTLSQSFSSLLVNTATITGTSPDPVSGNNSSTATGSIDESADLAVSTTGPATVVAGTRVEWTVVITNNGPSDAREVTLRELVPVSLRDVTVVPEGGGADCGTTCALGAIGNGSEVRLVVSGMVPAGTAPGTVLRQQPAISSATPDPDGDNNSAAADVTVTAAARLAVVKTVQPEPLVPGTDATYRIVVSNDGPSDAQATVATDPLPEGLTVRAPGSSSTQGSCAAVGRVQSCDLGVLPAGSSVTITVPVTVDVAYAGTSMVNTASVSSPTPDTDPDPAARTGTSDAAVAAVADLTLTKTGPATIVAGQALSWVLTVGNTGPSVARDVVVTDVLPDGLLDASAVASRGDCSFGVDGLTCAIGDLAPGDTTRIRVFLDGGLDPSFTGTEIVNAAQVASSTPEPGEDPADGRSASATTTVTRAADLSVVKVPDAAVFTPGTEAGWTVTVTNTGPSTATDVLLTETLPTGLDDVVITRDGTPVVCEAGVCELGDLLPGRDNAIVLRVTGTIDPTLDGTELANTVAVSSGTPDPAPGNNSVTATTPLTAAAHLVVDKTGPTTIVAGGEISWTITVGNPDGPSTARDVVLTDVLPTGVTGVTFSGDGVCPDAATGGTSVECTLGDLAVGDEVQVVVTGTVDPAFTLAQLTNTAQVRSATADPDPGAGDDTSSLATDVTTAADLSVTKTGPATVVAGQTISWTVEVTSSGPSVARDVVVNDIEPVGVTGLGGSWADGTCTDGVCEIGDLAPGATVVITYTGTVDPAYDGALLVNTATVGSDTADPDTTNDLASSSTTVTRSANLALTKTVAPDPLQPGGTVTWTLTATNNGPSTAEGVLISDSVPAAVTGLTATSTDGTCTITGQAVSCPAAGPIAPGRDVVVTITGTLAGDVGAGTISNTGAVTATTPDPDLTDNGASAGAGTPQADLRVTKTAGTAAFTPGGAASWTIEVVNDGPGTARGVLLSDRLPAGFTGATATVPSGTAGTCTAGDTVTCALGDLPAGATVTVTVAATVPATASGDAANTVSVVSPDETDPSDNTAQAVTPVLAAADLSLTKVAAAETATAGGTVSWRLTVTNDGPVTAPAVVITDPLPAGVTPGTLGDDAAGCSATGSVIRCDIGDLAAGASVSRTITGVVDPGVRETLSNTASVSSGAVDPDPSDNTATARTPVIADSSLSVSKTADRASAEIGQVVTYTITVAEQGSSSAEGVGLVETIPVGGRLVRQDAGQGSYGEGVWTIGTLQPGVPAVLVLEVVYEREGQTVNSVMLTRSGTPVDMTADADVEVLAQGSSPDPGAPGDPGTPPAPGTPPPPGGGLPVTGVPADDLSLWALLLLLAGGALLLGGRRRRGES